MLDQYNIHVFVRENSEVRLQPNDVDVGKDDVSSLPVLEFGAIVAMAPQCN